MTEAFVRLSEVASASVKQRVRKVRVPVTDKAEIKQVRERVNAKLNKERKARKLAEARAQTAEKFVLAAALLDEADAPETVGCGWFDELVQQPDEEAMRQLLERRVAERHQTLAELRESFGLDRIEGNAPRASMSTTPRADSLAEKLGIDADELTD